MGAIGGMIGGAAGTLVKSGLEAMGVDTGPAPGSTLEDFLTNFNQPGGLYSKSLDPLGTFDVEFRFFPDAGGTGKQGFLDGLIDGAMGALKQAGTNLLDSATGGLFSSLTAEDVMKLHNKFDGAGERSFAEYIAEAHSIGKVVGGQLNLDLGPYVQRITVPSVKGDGSGSDVQTSLGKFPINDKTVVADGILTMDVVNTRAALHERLFYPWLREVSLPYWSYNSQPYTTATITVDFRKHADVKYVFTGCRPNSIKLIEAT